MASLICQQSISGSIKKDGNSLEVSKLYTFYDTETETLQRLVVATNNQMVLLDKKQMRRLQFQERCLTSERIRDNDIAAKVRQFFV